MIFVVRRLRSTLMASGIGSLSDNLTTTALQFLIKSLIFSTRSCSCLHELLLEGRGQRACCLIGAGGGVAGIVPVLRFSRMNYSYGTGCAFGRPRVLSGDLTTKLELGCGALFKVACSSTPRKTSRIAAIQVLCPRPRQARPESCCGSLLFNSRKACPAHFPPRPPSCSQRILCSPCLVQLARLGCVLSGIPPPRTFFSSTLGFSLCFVGLLRIQRFAPETHDAMPALLSQGLSSAEITARNFSSGFEFGKHHLSLLARQSGNPVL